MVVPVITFHLVTGTYRPSSLADKMAPAHVPGGLSRQQLATQRKQSSILNRREGDGNRQGAHGEKQASCAAFPLANTSPVKATGSPWRAVLCVNTQQPEVQECNQQV